jgi:hypothetical protein
MYNTIQSSTCGLQEVFDELRKELLPYKKAGVVYSSLPEILLKRWCWIFYNLLSLNLADTVRKIVITYSKIGQTKKDRVKMAALPDTTEALLSDAKAPQHANKKTRGKNK